MKHEMHLFEKQFDNIKAGRKKIEVRLYDEKRRKIRIGDMIIFSKLPENKEKIKTKVIGLCIFKNFIDFYSFFDSSLFAHPEGITLDEQIQRERKTYSEEKEQRYGVIGIHIQLE